MISFPFILSSFCHDCQGLKHFLGVSKICPNQQHSICPSPSPGVVVSVTRVLGSDSTHLSHLPASPRAVSAPATVRSTLRPWAWSRDGGWRPTLGPLRAGPRPRDGPTLRSRLFNETRKVFEELIIAVFFGGGLDLVAGRGRTMKIVSLDDWSFDLFLTCHRFPTISLLPRSILVFPSHGGTPGCRSCWTRTGLCRGDVSPTPSLPFHGSFPRGHVEGRVLGVGEKYFAL